MTLHQHTAMNNCTIVIMITIVTDEFTIFIQKKVVWRFLWYCSIFTNHFKVYSHLPCINTQRHSTSTFSTKFPSSRVSLIYWYYKNTVLRFVWYCLVFIQLILKFVYMYPASTQKWRTTAEFYLLSQLSQASLLHW